MRKQQFTLSAVYDTETTNLYEGENSRAFPCLFIVNDIRGIDLYNYVENRDDNVKYFRYEQEMQEYIDRLIAWGREVNTVPIIAAYNLMFDLTPLLENLRARYKMTCCAQSSTHVYVMDLFNKDDELVLRFWDTYYLELRGLAAMGETCGLAKAKGDWDYDLIRNNETYLTADELHYAKRDVQVIPAYLKFLLHSNDWLRQTDFGVTVMTKTSLVRQMAKREIGNIKKSKSNRKKISQSKMFSTLCQQELPKTFESYGLRRACFRGGLTFTSAKYAMQVVENVASMDVTSMHHAFINGRYIPVQFEKANKEKLEQAYDYTVNEIDLQDVLFDYHRPFAYGFHMLVRFDNIRIKEGTCFDEWGIATIPSAKFRNKAERWNDESKNNYADIYSEEMNRLNGWIDRAENPVFAFGKLYSADSVFLHLTEVELWSLTLVYEWDSHECILGEVTQKWNRPPDYVTLQSNLLYGMKDDVKEIIKRYKKGEKYEWEIPDTIPDNLAIQIKNGAISEHFLESYYTSTVKGQFNSIYGTMAQDVYRPNYVVLPDGTLQIDYESQIRKDNFLLKQPEWCRVLYTYGMRIVGGSRLHLIIAMKLLYDKLGNKVRVTGGDTDSIKISCDADATDYDLLDALEPLHVAITNAINETQERVREEYPNLTSDLHDVGCFEIEDCGGSTRYKYHQESWNKARVSIDVNDKVHVTCAGLSRPSKFYNIEDFIADMLKEYPVDKVLNNCIAYNTWVSQSLSFALEAHRPATTDILDDIVIDYRGHKQHVVSHQSNALYESARQLGDISQTVNTASIDYVYKKYGRVIETDETILSLDDNGDPVIIRYDEVFMQGKRSGK